MQARGTPSAPLLFFLQEQRPPESSPVAGDGERAPSSRYPEPPEAAPPPCTPSRRPLPSPPAPLHLSSCLCPAGGRSRQGRRGGAQTPCSCGRSASGGSSSSSSRVACGVPQGRTGVGVGAAALAVRPPELPCLSGLAEPRLALLTPHLHFLVFRSWGSGLLAGVLPPRPLRPPTSMCPPGLRLPRSPPCAPFP